MTLGVQLQPQNNTKCRPCKFDVTPARSATYCELREIYSSKFPLSRNSLLPGYAPSVVGIRLPGGKLPLTIPQGAFVSVRHAHSWVNGIQARRLPVTLLLSTFSSCIAPLSLRPSYDGSFFVKKCSDFTRSSCRRCTPPSYCRVFVGQSRAGFLRAANHAPGYRRLSKGRLPEAGGQWLVGAR